MKVILVLIVVLATYGTSLSAPSTSGVSGTVANGQSITISGSGFGTTGPSVVLFDSFEKGNTGSNISTTTGSADIGNWSYLGSPSQTYSTGAALSGSKSMLINWATMYGSGPQLNFPDVENSDILVSWWQYMPTNKVVPGTSGGSPNWKWFWIGDNSGWPWGSDYLTVCLSDTCGSMISLSAGDDRNTPTRYGYTGGWAGTSFSKGTWMRYTVAMKNATSGAYGWAQEVSADGHFVRTNFTNEVTAHSGEGWDVLTLPGFGRQDSNAAAYYDDVYVATGAGARARVEIGNASTYSACTNLAIATPTSWSDTSITATVRAGSFAGGAAYLYVVDSTGSVSPAREVTIGSGGSTITCYQDADNDLYGHGVSESVESCSSGYYIASHFTALTGDCNDNNANIKPGATDVCGNGIDEDCSGADASCVAGGMVIGVGSTRIVSGAGNTTRIITQ